MHKILVIRLYFPLDALHVSDCVSPSSGVTFISCTSHLVYAGICRYHTSGFCVAIAKQQPDVSVYTGINQTKFFLQPHNIRTYRVKQITTYQICNIQLVNAPEDGQLRSEMCRAAKCCE